MNKETNARVIRRKPTAEKIQDTYGTVDKNLKNERLIERLEKNKEFHTRSDKLIGDKFCFLNWKWKEANASFPDEPSMRHVRKCYPQTKWGMILVDEPDQKHEIERCERKKAALEQLGYKYIILKPGMTPGDDQMELDRICGLLPPTRSQS